MEQKPVSLSTVIIASVASAVVLAGLGFTVRQEVLNSTAAAVQQQQAALDKLSTRISALESQTGELAARPTTDVETINNLRTELGTANSTITTLNERITSLEQEPVAPVVVAPSKQPSSAREALKSSITSGAVFQAELDIWDKEHPKSAVSIPTLRQYADTGIATEASLRSRLKELIARETAATETFPDKSVAARINTHLSGLISIKKKTPAAAAIQALRDGADSLTIGALITQVANVPSPQSGTFAGWLEDAKAHTAAYAELTSLESAQ